jgi:signal transduction histidine kinase
VEEIIDSLYFGSVFQRMSLRHLEMRAAPAQEDAHALRKLDAMHAQENMQGEENEPSSDGLTVFDDVSIWLDIDPECAWLFHVQAGAIRRIVMNLFGNCLKYTSKGTVGVEFGGTIDACN